MAVADQWDQDQVKGLFVIVFLSLWQISTGMWGSDSHGPSQAAPGDAPPRLARGNGCLRMFMAWKALMALMQFLLSALYGVAIWFAWRASGVEKTHFYEISGAAIACGVLSKFWYRLARDSSPSTSGMAIVLVLISSGLALMSVCVTFIESGDRNDRSNALVDLYKNNATAAALVSAEVGDLSTSDLTISGFLQLPFLLWNLFGALALYSYHMTHSNARAAAGYPAVNSRMPMSSVVASPSPRSSMGAGVGGSSSVLSPARLY